MREIELDEVELAQQAIAASDPHRAAAHLSRVIGDAQTSMDPRRVAFACAHIGDLFQNQLLNKVAARPWYRRAIRLLETAEPCVEQGWVAVAPMGCDVDDPELLLERASFALGRARAFFDVELEVKALADAGLARVQIGDIDEGMTMLDESMALICGGAMRDGDVIAKSVCSFYTACGYAADLARVELWTQTLVQCGIVGDTAGRALYLRHHCDSVRASLLARIGRWSEAESILLNTEAAMQVAMPGAA